MPLKITIPAKEYYDSSQNLFINVNETTILLEHSLYAMSLWEAKWKVSFLFTDKKTDEQIIDYIRCMSLTEDVDPIAYYGIPMKEIKRINDYINDPATATTFSSDKDKNKKTRRKIITTEEIYYQMTALNIPFECEKWNFNRLQTLIRVCSIKNSPKKKMSKKDVYSKYRSLNESRRKALNTTG